MKEMKTSSLTNDTTLALLVLVAATGVAWWLGQADRVGGQAGALATAGVIVVAFFKVWIVGFQFMELRYTPRWLRHAFDAWTVMVCVALVAICIR